jgi:hypothetical protein
MSTNDCALYQRCCTAMAATTSSGHRFTIRQGPLNVPSLDLSPAKPHAAEPAAVPALKTPAGDRHVRWHQSAGRAVVFSTCQRSVAHADDVRATHCGVFKERGKPRDDGFEWPMSTRRAGLELPQFAGQSCGGRRIDCRALVILQFQLPERRVPARSTGRKAENQLLAMADRLGPASCRHQECHVSPRRAHMDMRMHSSICRLNPPGCGVGSGSAFPAHARYQAKSPLGGVASHGLPQVTAGWREACSRDPAKVAIGKAPALIAASRRPTFPNLTRNEQAFSKPTHLVRMAGSGWLMSCGTTSPISPEGSSHQSSPTTLRPRPCFNAR